MQVLEQFRYPNSSRLDDSLDLEGKYFQRFYVTEFVKKGHSPGAFVKPTSAPEGSMGNGWLNIDELQKWIFQQARAKYDKQVALSRRAEEVVEIDLETGERTVRAPAEKPNNDRMQSVVSRLLKDKLNIDVSDLPTSVAAVIKPKQKQAFLTSAVLCGTASNILMKTIYRTCGANLRYVTPAPLWRFLSSAESTTVQMVSDAVSYGIDELELSIARRLPRKMFFTPSGVPTPLGRMFLHYSRKTTRRNWMKHVAAFMLSVASFIVSRKYGRSAKPYAHYARWFSTLSFIGSFGYLNAIVGDVLDTTHRTYKVGEAIMNDERAIMNFTSRESMRKHMTAGAVTVMAMVAAIKVWHLVYRSQNPAHELTPLQPRSTGWFGSFKRSSPPPSISDKTVSPAQINGVIAKGMVTVVFNAHKTHFPTRTVRGWIYAPNRLLTVKHLFTDTGRKRGELMSGELTVKACGIRNKSDPVVYPHNIVPLGESDLAIVHLDKCYPVGNQVDLFAREKYTGNSAIFRYVYVDDSVKATNVTAYAREVGYAGARTKGLSVPNLTPELACEGNCGQLLVSTSNSCAVHAMLFSADGHSCAQFEVVDRSMIDAAEVLLRERQMFPAMSASDIPTESFGIRHVVDWSLHPQAASHFPDFTGSVVAHGTTKQRMKTKSGVVPRKISDLVEKYCNVPRKHGAPMFHGKYEIDGETKRFNQSHWFNVAIEKIHVGAKNVDEELMLKAREDYIEPLRSLAQGKRIDPLSTHEVMNGRYGKEFMDVMNFSTSMGFPVFQPKDKFFDQCPEKHIWSMGSQVKEEYEKALANYKSGNRFYPVFSAMLKDEAVKIGKEKVRVFYACPVIFTMLTRKYYLPLIQFLLEHRDESEIAVGINCASSQWDKMNANIKRFITDDKQVLGFDYSGYDKAFAPNAMRTAYDILIELAEIMGYKAEDLAVMRLIARDAMNPMVDWNGTLISTSSLHPSGNSLTVIINSMVNCLLVRSYFYQQRKDGNFRKSVAMITYGDDALGTVKSDDRMDINFKGYARFLEKIGMRITHPSKKASDDFHEDEMDFLKRKSVFHEALGYCVGALDKDSIFKSLHCQKKIKTVDSQGRHTGNSPETVASSAIDCALHEMALHGRSHYESFQKQIQALLNEWNEVADNPAINNDACIISYDARIAKIIAGDAVLIAEDLVVEGEEQQT